METKEFIAVMHRTLDNFIDSYKTAPSNLRRIATDNICYEFIELATPYEAYQLGFKDYYDLRKEK